MRSFYAVYSVSLKRLFVQKFVFYAVFETYRKNFAIQNYNFFYDRIDEILDDFRVDFSYHSMGMDNLESRKVESIKDRMVFTQTVLGHIDTMLELYKNKCLNSEREEVRRKWRVLEAMYLTENVGVPDDVADAEHINTRTVFKDLNVAIQDLSGLFFGIDLSDIILF